MTQDTKLRALISPTVTEIDGDLQSFAHRVFPQPGKKQVDFTPTEVILCLAASRVVKYNSYGGQNIDRVPSPVPELARLFQRSPGSLTSKMGNLFGARPNKGTSETDAAEWYLEDPNRIIEAHALIVDRARSLGLSEDSLPDFLPREPGRWGNW